MRLQVLLSSREESLLQRRSLRKNVTTLSECPISWESLRSRWDLLRDSLRRLRFILRRRKSLRFLMSTASCLRMPLSRKSLAIQRLILRIQPQSLKLLMTDSRISRSSMKRPTAVLRSWRGPLKRRGMPFPKPM